MAAVAEAAAAETVIARIPIPLLMAEAIVVEIAVVDTVAVVAEGVEVVVTREDQVQVEVIAEAGAAANRL